jgi:nicotinamidase-related amidase
LSRRLSDFVPDPSGPRGIAVRSWLERQRLALMVIDAQNYITLPEYSGTWSAAGGDDYYYRRLREVVLPNLQRLLAAFRSLGCLVVYTRIAALNENLKDVPGLTRKVLADRGYLCTIVEDACISPSAEDHEAALRSLGKYYGWVAGTDEVLAALGG